MTKPTIPRSIALPWVIPFFVNDDLLIITISKVLHPRHKLEYFMKAGWTQEWINEARAIVCDEYERSYEALVVDLKADSESDEPGFRKVS